MKKTFCILGLIVSSIVTLSQSGSYFISGRVIDAVSKVPLQSASVFAQNTTIGTITDKEGKFKLAFPLGGYDLVITFTGCQTETKRINITDANDALVIELRHRENELETVIISTSSEVHDGWKQYGDFFIENFIGKTDNSKSCAITNKETLKFYFSKKRNRLKILANEPIEIVNTALGYTIKYTIDSFVYDYNKQVTIFTGYPLFKEMQSFDSAQKNTWETSRLKAYNGSMLHFMRSLYNKRLKEEGFDIKFLIKIGEKEKLVPLRDFYETLNYSKNDSTKIVEILPKQNEFAIFYNKAKPERTYIDANPNAPGKFQLSSLSFLQNLPIIIEVNGFYYKQTGITKSNYYSWKRIADMLPYDFKMK